MNDFSARGLQMEEMKLSLGPAKGKDFATGLGPVPGHAKTSCPESRPSPRRRARTTTSRCAPS